MKVRQLRSSRRKSGFVGASTPSLVPVDLLASPIVSVGGGWTPVFTTNNAWGAAINQANLQNDQGAWDVLLGPGTWRMELFHRADTNCPIYTITLDGAAPSTYGGSADTIDGYNAAATATRSAITGIVLPSVAVRRLNFAAPTKNAASSAFVSKLCKAVFTKTA